MIGTGRPGGLAGTEPRRAAAGSAYSAAGLLVLLVAGVGAGTLLAGPAAAGQRAASGVQEAVSRIPGLIDVVREAAGLGSPVAAAVVLVLLGSALLLDGRRRLAGYVAVTAAGAGVLGAGTGAAAAALTSQAPAGPGGHTLSAVVAYGLLLVVLTPAVPPRWRRGAAVAVVALVALVGLARFAVGVAPAPLVLGMVLGVAWLGVTTTAFGHRARLARDGPYRPVGAGRAPAAPRPWVRAGALAAIWLLLLGALLSAGALVTGSAAVQRADAAVTGWFVAIRAPTLTPVAEVFGALGDTPTVVAGALTLAALVAVATRSTRPVSLVVLVLGGELALFLVSAGVVDRSRPDVGNLGLLVPPTSSFPSGHVSAAVCLYGLAALLAARVLAPRLRWSLAAAAAAVLAVAVGSGRIYFGMHHPSDVLASLLFAVPWLLACLRLGPPVRGGPG
ncbi:phosphatase PAP2 family protein [Pseudonocardia sp.]|uniref:phosphatase PAP2 family protein n=1 Tax=Pseudonocardia sp. TaxID=60912 RepID=UPI00263131A4|nr:phosphatase PAP2 family protein [Pseudonocardia sp.]